jgi:predicted ATPase
MAYFGYPQAHDDDAERAARAGLAILEAITRLNDRPARPKLAARVGIDSGTVVVGAGAGKDSDVFGDTPNIAARVQAIAEPGTVVITDAAHRLVSGLFVVEDRGAQALKGIERPLQLYRVVQPSGVRGRLEAVAAARGLTPFVGREDELRLLINRWERVLDGEGQVVLVLGEAGIGKSRLMQRFHEQIAGTPHTWIEAGASAFFQNTPFHPVAEMLHQFLGDAAGQEPLAQFESHLAAAGLQPAEAIPLLAPLLKLPTSARYPPSTLSPEQQRRRLLATLVDWVLGLARAQPLVIATEDLHWVDPSTLELIQLLVEQGATAQLLLLYTARPEFRGQWPQRAHHAQIRLNRLGARDSSTMVAQVATSGALSDDTVAKVIERTGGIPLFVEELTRSVLEGGDAKITGHEIPATLHDSLMARLDRLGAAKEVLQIGAVIGSDFSYELLHAVHSSAETDLHRALSSLTDAELLYVRGIAPDAAYQFRHAIRDAAYEALLKGRRKELHLSVARTIDEKFPSLKETHPEVLARHWTVAGEGLKAIEYLELAGERAATRVAAHSEAIAHFSAALDWLERLLPPIDEAQHCSLLFKLGREQRKAGELLKAQESQIRSAAIAQTLGATESVFDAALDLVRLTFQFGLSPLGGVAAPWRHAREDWSSGQCA